MAGYTGNDERLAGMFRRAERRQQTLNVLTAAGRSNRNDIENEQRQRTLNALTAAGRPNRNHTENEQRGYVTPWKLL